MTTAEEAGALFPDSRPSMSNELGLFLCQLRTARGWSLTQASEAAGVARATLHRWERGKFYPRLPELDAVLAVLEATPQQKRRAVALVDAPRAQTQVREDIHRFGQMSGIGPIPGRGDLLRALRLRQGLTLDTVASGIGVSTRTLRFWEKGEIWPTADKLHNLCILLKAHEQEIIALTCMTGSPTAAPAIPHDRLEVHLVSLIDRMDRAHDPLLELDFITMAEQAWRLAARKSSGRHLLAETYARYASFLSTRGRFTETAQIADRALELRPEKSSGEMFWLYAGIASATAAVYQGARPAPQRGIKILRQWLPAAHDPAFQAWIVATMAEYQVMADPTAYLSDAVDLADQACRIAQEATPIERFLRNLDKARILILARRPAEALELLEYLPGTVASDRAAIALLLTEASRDVGAIAEAQYWLHQAFADIDECVDRQSLWNRAEALGQGL